MLANVTLLYYNESEHHESDFGSFPVVPVIKIAFGFIIVIFYAIVIVSLTICTSIGYSSRMFLIMIFSYNMIYYSMLTFYAPFVAAGFISQIENLITLKIISVIILTPIYAMHLGHTISAFDRFIAVRYSSRHDRLFSPIVTKMLLTIVFLYGIGFGLISWANCCYFVYKPTSQSWSYPNDGQTGYRTYSGLISNWGNALVTGSLYITVLCYLRKMNNRITDVEIRRIALKKELTVTIIFAVPWFVNILSAGLLLAIQQLPPGMVGNGLAAFSETARYAYALEPVLTFLFVKQVRCTLRRNLLACSNNSTTILTTNIS